MPALTGIRVIDLTNAVAGSSSTKLLADLGADVIKVENPSGGDFTRALMPFMYHTHNRNKRSLAIDLRSDDGVALIRRLAADADVFVQSLRPGAATALGLDRDTLRAANPRLVYASFSAFGAHSPDAARRGVDAVAQAESGMVEIQGRLLGNVSYVDTAAGLALSHAILAALLHRERTGEVDWVEVNLLDTALYMQSAPLAEFSVTGEVADQEAYLARFPVAGLFPASDGRFQVNAYWEHDWTALCQLIGRADLLEDSRFRDAQQRRQNAAALRAILEAVFQTQSRKYWVRRLTDAGILCGKVRDYAEVVADAQDPADETFERLDIGDGMATFVRAPFRFNSRAATPTRPAPALGADTAAVLSEAGLTPDEIEALSDRGVLGAATGPAGDE
ncbi:MAG: CoA transferase [Sphingomonas bacterium]|nr:CoA transferase [Sphingomonas bacterium]